MLYVSTTNAAFDNLVRKVTNPAVTQNQPSALHIRILNRNTTTSPEERCAK